MERSNKILENFVNDVLDKTYDYETPIKIAYDLGYLREIALIIATDYRFDEKSCCSCCDEEDVDEEIIGID